MPIYTPDHANLYSRSDIVPPARECHTAVCERVISLPRVGALASASPEEHSFSPDTKHPHPGLTPLPSAHAAWWQDEGAACNANKVLTFELYT